MLKYEGLVSFKCVLIVISKASAYFDFKPFLQGDTRLAKLLSAYISLIIGPRCFGCDINL